ncbi:MAG: hypothetical protein SOX26_10705 [Phocaeicola sp.]|nr:hypothetical protein [Phocaeicola sp.]
MYEARQNKEKVSRRIDAAGGRVRQRVKFEDTRRMSLHLKEVLIQKKTIKNNNLTKAIIQAILVTDVPTTQDFSQITDLAIWWAMAAEYHFQKQLPANIPNAANLNPLNYIYSLSDYLPGAPLPQQQINVGQGDRVRMLTHGVDPNDVHGGHTIIVNNRIRRANPIIANINRNINGVQVTPLYCYMGDNPMHRYLIPGIGPGPMLSPTMGSVSLRNDKNAIQYTLSNAGNANTWSHIIDNNGSWLDIRLVNGLNTLFVNYSTSVRETGIQSNYTLMFLRRLLNAVFDCVDQPYNDFTTYLQQQNLSTGQGQTLWS